MYQSCPTRKSTGKWKGTDWKHPLSRTTHERVPSCSERSLWRSALATSPRTFLSGRLAWGRGSLCKWEGLYRNAITCFANWTWWNTNCHSAVRKRKKFFQRGRDRVRLRQCFVDINGLESHLAQGLGMLELQVNASHLRIQHMRALFRREHLSRRRRRCEGRNRTDKHSFSLVQGGCGEVC